MRMDAPKIPFSRAVCDGRELELIKEVLDSGWLTTGPMARRFESQFAEAVEAPFACAVNSCTAALHLALEAIGIAAGDKVIVPTWTFTASAEAVRYLGGEPILVDVEESTGLLTPEIVRQALYEHPDAKAVIVVHFGGQPAEMVSRNGLGILDICRAHGVRVIEDAAHAFPTRLLGQAVGSFGDATCFSFYANKTITTGEGGMLTTADEAIYRRVCLMRLHGIDRDAWNRFSAVGAPWEYDVLAPGFKYNMPDICAAIGLAQLERADELRERRQRLAEQYFRELDGIAELTLPTFRCLPHEHAWHLFPVVLNIGGELARHQVIQHLNAGGIGTSVHYKPLHRMTYYRDRYQLSPEAFPNAERIWSGCISLPLHAWLTAEEVSRITDSVRMAVAHVKSGPVTARA
jgi:dTDP-4-amino-4,6-dideoxygalactose transaminase